MKDIWLKTFENEDDQQLDLTIKEIENNAKITREKIMNGNFNHLQDTSNQDDKIKFINQFINLVPECVLFPDDELFNKLREYRFGKSVFDWFVPIENIIYEFKELRKIEESFFPLSGYLISIHDFLRTKIKCEIVESFDLGVKHGKKEESNIARKNFDNMLRRLAYHEDKNQIAELDPIELLFLLKMKSKESLINNEVDFKKNLLSAMHGNFEISKESLSTFAAFNISKNEVYFHLFPLVKLIFKDVKLYSEEEFDNLPTIIYGGSYRKYRISRVKKTLGIK